ncbi:MAG TPA: hypothetical protein VE093_16890 [Polyangiaceae bacterium]|nr:hypothetical protein [Polyangiaceae bacterium]
MRLALSRTIRSVIPSDATPHIALSAALRYSCASPKALRLRTPSPYPGASVSRPLPAGASTTGTRPPRAASPMGYVRSAMTTGAAAVSELHPKASRSIGITKRSVRAFGSAPLARPAAKSAQSAWATRQ